MPARGAAVTLAWRGMCGLPQSRAALRAPAPATDALALTRRFSGAVNGDAARASGPGAAPSVPPSDGGGCNPGGPPAFCFDIDGVLVRGRHVLPAAKAMARQVCRDEPPACVGCVSSSSSAMHAFRRGATCDGGRGPRAARS